MSTPPWEADRALTSELAASTIRELFPTVDASELRLLGSGWEFDVYATRDGWVFRFPRRAHCVELFGPEHHVHRLVASVLPSSVAIPRVELSGQAAKGFPYEVAGHRLIAGVSANAVDPSVLPTMARSMGEALSCIHAIPESDARAAGVIERPLDDENVIRWFERGMRAVADRHWPDQATRRAVNWVGEQRTRVRSPTSCCTRAGRTSGPSGGGRGGGGTRPPRSSSAWIPPPLPDSRVEADSHLRIHTILDDHFLLARGRKGTPRLGV